MPNSHTVLLHKRRAGMTLVKSSMAFFFFFGNYFFSGISHHCHNSLVAWSVQIFKYFVGIRLYVGLEVHMTYWSWIPLILPLWEVITASHCIPSNAFVYQLFQRGFFLLLQDFKYQTRLEMTVLFFSFFAGNQIFLEQAVITIGAALVTESCVISQLVCYSLDSSTVSEII